MSASNQRARRSGRTRKIPQKYSIDPFAEIEDIVSPISGEDELERDTSVEADSDDDFDAGNINEVEQDVEEEMPDSDGDSVLHAGDPTVDEYNGELEETSKPTGKPKRIWKPPVSKEAHTMGLNSTRAVLALAKLDRVSTHIGPNVDDLVAFVHYRDLWLNKHNFPQKDQIGYSLFYPPARRAQEAVQGFQWYYNGGKDIFRDFQAISTRSSSQTTGVDELAVTEHRFLSGAIQNQKMHKLAGLQSVLLKDVIDLESGTPSSTTRQGWILNVGKRLQCLEWVPNRSDKPQLLSLSYSTKVSYQSTNSSKEDFRSPFRPLPPARSEFYIWEIDLSQRPKLRAVISYDWNHLRSLSWCPCSVKDDEDEDMELEHLGLLAGVWLDGHIRILDINIPKQEGVAYIHLSKAAFDSKPPDTIVTCLTWLSPGSIAAACADGHVAIWNIAQHLDSVRGCKHPVKNIPVPRPWFFKRVHETYIVSIVSGYPSRPWAIFTNSLDGYCRLTDVRDPEADNANLKRVRVNRPALIWHDATQQMIISDDNWDITSHYLRVFPTREIITRWTAMVLNLAQSSFHSSVLVSCSDGSVGAANVARRMKRMKHNSSNAIATRNIWFRYEWRDAVQPDWNIPRDETNPVDQDVLTRPLSRFLDGFKGEHIKTANYALENIKNGQSYNTVYERETAVTHVCWNPNLEWSTWAAAATGTGLIRIEDIGIQ